MVARGSDPEANQPVCVCVADKGNSLANPPGSLLQDSKAFLAQETASSTSASVPTAGRWVRVTEVHAEPGARNVYSSGAHAINRSGTSYNAHITTSHNAPTNYTQHIHAQTTCTYTRIARILQYMA